MIFFYLRILGKQSTVFVPITDAYGVTQLVCTSPVSCRVLPIQNHVHLLHVYSNFFLCFRRVMGIALPCQEVAPMEHCF